MDYILKHVIFSGLTKSLSISKSFEFELSFATFFSNVLYAVVRGLLKYKLSKPWYARVASSSRPSSPIQVLIP